VLSGGGEFVYDSEVVDWVNRVVANGGSVSQSTKGAVNTFMVSIKAAGLRAKIARLNLYAGTGIDACRTPLIKSIGTATDTLNNFVSGDYSEATGLTGNTTTKYLDTGVTIAALDTFNHPATFNPVSWGVYVRTASNESSATMGVADTVVTFTQSYLIVSDIGGHTQFSMSDYNVGNYVNATDSAGVGFYLGVRANDAAGSGVIYKNGTSIATFANLGNYISTMSKKIYVHAVNNSDTSAFAWTAKTLAGYQLSGIFDATEQSTLRGIWQTFQTALSRKV